MSLTFHSNSIDKFIVHRPNEKLKNLSWNLEDELEQLRKELIETFFQTALSYTDVIIKRKLGILTTDVCDYYRFKKRPTSISSDEFHIVHETKYDHEENLSDLLIDLQHICVTCPLDFVLVDDTKLTSSSWSHVYMCDICHCTRALQDNMIRHLETESHLSATEYRTDSATMILSHCIRRSSLQIYGCDRNIFDSIIMCPICYELFSNINSCAMHSHLSHNMDYIYSIGSVAQTFDVLIKQDENSTECDEHLQTLSLISQSIDEHKQKLYEINECIHVFLCPINKCYYRTKHFFNFRIHLISMHSNSFDLINKTIKVKLKQFMKPKTYMHITRFLHKNHVDINEELKTLEQLEYDMKYFNDDKHILKVIKKRSDLLKTL